jgi:hypothetical protein
MKTIPTNLALSAWLLQFAVLVIGASSTNSETMDTVDTGSTPRGVLGKPSELVGVADSARLQRPNAYLKKTPIAFWLNPGLGFSSNGYSAVTGLNASARNGLFVSLQGTATGNLRFVHEAHEYASTASLLGGYRIPQSDFFATFGLGPVLGEGESSKQIKIEIDCDFPRPDGCHDYDYQRRKHKGLGFMAQAQVGTSNRYLGLTAQLHWMHFDGLSVLGIMVGLPMGLLY